jgi:hypothetical protein
MVVGTMSLVITVATVEVQEMPIDFHPKVVLELSSALQRNIIHLV